MFFKKLELNGFKSFADKTTLKFERGITAIVGPNGCGKSNITDAIRWVLGEQGTKVLRVQRMEDLIFNGSLSRKPDGYAQVSITIENDGRDTASITPEPDNGNGNPLDTLEEIVPSKRHLDWNELSEITVARRYYRSGESECLINKEPVRLKDITDLFLDTGLGENAYSIIERDKVDLILNSKPEDRRFIFEEAAGITKYRHRKIEAMRRLEETQANILRIRDIIAEVKRSINAVRRQVSRAERYKKHSAELKEIEVKMNLYNLRNMTLEWDTYKKDLEIERKKEEKFRRETSSIEDKIEKLKRILQEKEEGLRSERDRHYEIISFRERAASQVSVLTERKKNLSEKEEEFRKELARLKEGLSSLDDSINRIENEMKEIKSKIEQKKSLVRQREDEIKSVDFELQEAQKRYKDYLCFCCAVCNWRDERDKKGCFLLGKRFSEIKDKPSSAIDYSFTKPALSIQEEIEKLEKKKELLRSELEKEKMEIVSLKGKIDAKTEIASDCKKEKEELLHIKEKMIKESEEFPTLLKNIDEETEKFKTEFEKFSKEIEENRDDISKYEEDYRKTKDVLMEEEEKLREMRRIRAEDERNLRELEIKEVQFKLQSENIIQKLHQEYNVDVGQDLNLVFSGLPDDFSLQEAENQTRLLREKIERIGQVNLVAIEEYQRLKERYLFLKKQADDLTRAEEDLKKIIDEIEKVCKIRFIETFDKIKENFESIYKRLFEGGEASLLFSNPEDPLGTGIEITAQPPGKKLQNIFLLSEGEQTMTAIALLFSIFLVKPSPFCFLDEIDAPLDDANILRFTKLLRDFSHISQFIVITHNKRTMEAANIIYGITMEEEGVSKLVSMKMGEPVPV